MMLLRKIMILIGDDGSNQLFIHSQFRLIKGNLQRKRLTADDLLAMKGLGSYISFLT